jgi:hypothetical protein
MSDDRWPKMRARDLEFLPRSQVHDDNDLPAHQWRLRSYLRDAAISLRLLADGSPDRFPQEPADEKDREPLPANPDDPRLINEAQHRQMVRAYMRDAAISLQMLARTAGRTA